MPLTGSLYSPARTYRDGTWPALPAGTKEGSFAESLGEGGGRLMTPFFPVCRGLGDVPSWSAHSLFLCQAGSSQQAPAGCWDAALAVSSVQELPLGGGLCFQAGKSGQTKLSRPVKDSGIP